MSNGVGQSVSVADAIQQVQQVVESYQADLAAGRTPTVGLSNLADIARMPPARLLVGKPKRVEEKAVKVA